MSSASGRKKGLPNQVAMRHDRHFVDELASHSAPAVGRLVPLASIQPDPHQPRSVVGDLSELVASIREKGVLEPILIRPNPIPRQGRRGVRDHLRRAPLPGRAGGRSIRDPGDRDGRHRRGGARNRPGREPPARGSVAVRGGGRLPRPGRAPQVHPREDRPGGRQVPIGHHREPDPAQDARQGPGLRPRARSRQQVDPARAPQARRREGDASAPGARQHARVWRARLSARRSSKPAVVPAVAAAPSPTRSASAGRTRSIGCP